jgi:hypothetical protein
MNQFPNSLATNTSSHAERGRGCGGQEQTGCVAPRKEHLSKLGPTHLLEPQLLGSHLDCGSSMALRFFVACLELVWE